MNKAKLSAELRRVAEVIDELPKFAEVIVVTMFRGKAQVQVNWASFSRLFACSTYERNSAWERVTAESHGITWTACRDIEAAPAVALPVAEAACEEGGRYA